MESAVFNEHGKEVNSQEIVENARVYTQYRDDQDDQGKCSVYMSLASRFVLFYIETLSRMDVVPNRDLYDFYSKSRCKGEK